MRKLFISRRFRFNYIYEAIPNTGIIILTRQHGWKLVLLVIFLVTLNVTAYTEGKGDLVSYIEGVDEE